MLAGFVASKGNDEYAVKHACMHLGRLGHKRVTMRSDQENAIEELARKIESKTAVGIVHNEFSVGESQSNGMVEKAVQNVQRQVRIMSSGREERSGTKLKRDHLISALLVIHVANTINRQRAGLDGRTT